YEPLARRATGGMGVVALDVAFGQQACCGGATGRGGAWVFRAREAVYDGPRYLWPSGPAPLRYLLRTACSRSTPLMLASVQSQARTSANSSSRFSPPEVVTLPGPPSPDALCRAVA